MGYAYAVVNPKTNAVHGVWAELHKDEAIPGGLEVKTLSEHEDPGPGRKYDPDTNTLVADDALRAEFALGIPKTPRPGEGLADEKTRAQYAIEDAKAHLATLAKERSGVELAEASSGLDYSAEFAALNAKIAAVTAVAEAKDAEAKV